MKLGLSFGLLVFREFLRFGKGAVCPAAFGIHSLAVASLWLLKGKHRNAPNCRLRGDVRAAHHSGGVNASGVPQNAQDEISCCHLATVAFFFASVFTIVGWVCSLIILRKMRFDGFGISDLWSPTGKLYRRYVQEAKRRDWSLLPVYLPAILGILFFCYFVVAVVLVLREAF